MDEHEGQTAELEETVEVSIFYRKPGQPSASSPNGYRKLVLKQPKSALAYWRQAKQYRVANQPNLTIVFDDRVLKPRVFENSEEEMEVEAAAVLVDDELSDLEVRKARLRSELITTEARIETLEESHLERRKAYQAEEERLQESVDNARKSLAELRKHFDAESAAIHEKLRKQAEFEKEMIEQSQGRITALEVEMTELMTERRESITKISALTREAEDGKKGSLPERLLEQAAERAKGAWKSGIGAFVLSLGANKAGMSEEQLQNIIRTMTGQPPKAAGE